MITYNILADQYASSDKGINKLFSYCPKRLAAVHAGIIDCGTLHVTT